MNRMDVQCTYNVQLSSLNCTLMTWLGIPQCVTLISHLVWLASSRAFREGTCQLAWLAQAIERLVTVVVVIFFVVGKKGNNYIYICGWQKMTKVIVFAWRLRKGTCQLV